jgi:two-component system, cell cycle sensor histidine kinase and response regulator CckA
MNNRDLHQARRLIDQSPDMIAVVNAKGELRYSNTASERITGFKPAELLRPWRELVHPEDQGLVLQQWAHCLEHPSALMSVQFRHTHKHLGYVQVEVIGRNCLKCPGVRGVVLNVRDVTARIQSEEERLALERQVLHSQKLESLAVLAGGIAHDFNNLLTAILGHSSLALLDLPEQSPTRRNLQEITKAAQRAAELAKQMLEFSGKGQFHIQRLQLNDLVQAMIHLLSVSLPHQPRWECSFERDLPYIQGDATQLREVIMQLITNAAEAISDTNGVITVSTSVRDYSAQHLNHSNLASRRGVDPPLPSGSYVCLEISDSGCGMDEITQQKVFDPFFSTKFAGRGLGLPSVLGIVRSHRGVLKLESKPGHGSRFQVLFASELTRPSTVSAISAPPAPGWRGQGLILLVDDEVSVRSVGKQMLERMGFTVLTAGDGVEALEVFEKRSTEILCVFLDMSMPRMDGEATFAALRKTGNEVPVILCSGFNEQEAVQRFAGKGLAGFLQKPYTHADLAAMLKKLF